MTDPRKGTLTQSTLTSTGLPHLRLAWLGQVRSPRPTLSSQSGNLTRLGQVGHQQLTPSWAGLGNQTTHTALTPIAHCSQWKCHLGTFLGGSFFARVLLGALLARHTYHSLSFGRSTLKASLVAMLGGFVGEPKTSEPLESWSSVASYLSLTGANDGTLGTSLHISTLVLKPIGCVPFYASLWYDRRGAHKSVPNTDKSWGQSGVKVGACRLVEGGKMRQEIAQIVWLLHLLLSQRRKLCCVRQPRSLDWINASSRDLCTFHADR